MTERDNLIFRRTEMYNFNEDAIREAAYYIWKNNGCPANSSLSDWDAAINQLSNQLKSSRKTASVRVLMPKSVSAKTPSLRNVKSIILKPAAALKSSSGKKTVKSTAKKTTKKSK